MCGTSKYPLIQHVPDGRVGYIAGYNHGFGDYLRAAMVHGYVVRACEETYLLHPWVREAANAAKSGHTAVVAWDFELRPDI